MDRLRPLSTRRGPPRTRLVARRRRLFGVRLKTRSRFRLPEHTKNILQHAPQIVHQKRIAEDTTGTSRRDTTGPAMDYSRRDTTGLAMDYDTLGCGIYR